MPMVSAFRPGNGEIPMLGHAQSLTETWHQRCIFVKIGVGAMRLMAFFPF
ncbi:MAG: hypothetical protein ABIK08_16630 [Pseudomonadota bacterium]